MQLFRVLDLLVGVFELFDLLKQLRLGLDVGKHFSTDQHLIQDQACTPYITFLVVLLQL